jgi:catechol 2,3-dioxygenase-like lactoylglutathione lyase family enzyme
MSSSDASSGGALEMSLEVLVIPVSDVDRAKDFYSGLGWRLDADVSRGDLRLVQFTPPGSGCSIQFGTHLTTAAPGSLQGTYLVVSDLEATRQALLALSVEVSETFHESGLGDRFHETDRVGGPSPTHATYGSFASFDDPDGNGWLLQEITTRLPGR